MFSQVIFKITITGTARIIPIKPHIHPHIDRDTIMINGDSPNGDSPRFRPCIFGSIKFPRTIFTDSITNATQITGAGFGQNCINANNVVPIPDMIEPKFGIKFSKKAMKPQMMGKSIPAASVPRKTKIPK